MEETHMSGLSDAMTKILQSKVKANNFILSKAKKDRDIVIDKSKCDDSEDSMQVVDDEGNTSRIEQDTDESSDDEKKKKKKNQASGKRTRRLNPVRRGTWDRESDLNAMATKGVVQLFNAVNQHRNLISSSTESSGNSERKRDKILSKFSTDTFMDILSSTRTGELKASKRKKFHDVLSEEVEETKIEQWESENSE